jgi:pyridoxine 4-dehydrogenase
MAAGQLGEKSVNRIGYGAMQLAGPGVFGPPNDPEQAGAVLRRAVELGVDHIDTSQYYGPDVVNDLIRDTLHPYPEGLRFVTKVGCRRDDSGNWLPAISAAEVRQGVEDNLRALNIERLDGVNLRPTEVEPTEALLAEGLGVLTEMKEEGKLDLIGISSVPAEAVELALGLADVAMVQNPFNIIDQSDRPSLDLAVERGLSYVPYFPLGSAFTGGPAAIAADPAIASVAEKHGVAASQVALAWLLSIDERVLLIPGTGTLAHLELNVAAGELELDAEDLAALEGVAQVGITPK